MMRNEISNEIGHALYDPVFFLISKSRLIVKVPGFTCWYVSNNPGFIDASSQYSEQASRVFFDHIRMLADLDKIFVLVHGRGLKTGRY
jgi:hypothetical protein